jgi:plasmid maintenance system antidote protein VapI
MPANRVSQIVAGRRMVTADTALRLGHRFGTDPRFWMNLQARFDLVAAERTAGERIRALPTGDAERAGNAARGDLSRLLDKAPDTPPEDAV